MFFTPALTDDFHWSLSDSTAAFAAGFDWSLYESKSPLVSRAHPSILAGLNSAVMWMVSILLLIFDSSSLSLGIIQRRRTRPDFVDFSLTSHYPLSSEWSLINIVSKLTVA